MRRLRAGDQCARVGRSRGARGLGPAPGRRVHVRHAALLESVRRVREAGRRAGQLPVDRQRRRRPAAHEGHGGLRRQRLPAERRTDQDGRRRRRPRRPRAGHDGRRVGRLQPADRRPEARRRHAERHLSRHNHEVERPEDRRPQQGRQDALDADPRRPPLGRERDDVHLHVVPGGGQLRSGSRRSAPPARCSGRRASAPRGARACRAR